LALFIFQVISIIGDVSKSADCQAIVQKAVDSFGALDVLVRIKITYQ
jgi:NAD(P)-dependent dehydrogenase (short-subunit alcohol dehydrogenase family)